jgi:hypothetical protein
MPGHYRLVKKGRGGYECRVARNRNVERVWNACAQFEAVFRNSTFDLSPDDVMAFERIMAGLFREQREKMVSRSEGG